MARERKTLRELALFAGAGGGILAGRLLGWRTVCAVEIDTHAAGVLLVRQNDESLEPFPIWDDVATFKGKDWYGIVDVVSGGFPCQDISLAGKGKGIEGERSGLWKHMARIIGEVRPRFALVENSPALTIRGLYRVLGDLAAMGYNAEWGVVGAGSLGFPHERKRVYILAYSDENGCEIPVTDCKEFKGLYKKQTADYVIQNLTNEFCETTEDDRLLRNVNGLACGVDRIERVGNGQVPQVVAHVWSALLGRAGLC